MSYVLFYLFNNSCAIWLSHQQEVLFVKQQLKSNLKQICARVFLKYRRKKLSKCISEEILTLQSSLSIWPSKWYFKIIQFWMLDAWQNAESFIIMSYVVLIEVLQRINLKYIRQSHVIFKYNIIKYSNKKKINLQGYEQTNMKNYAYSVVKIVRL